MTNLALKRLKVAAGIIIIILFVSVISLMVYSNSALYNRMSSFVKRNIEFREYTTAIKYNNPNHFSYDVTKVEIDKNGARLAYGVEKADLILLSPVKIDPDSKIVGFREDADKDRSSIITYQISTDYQHWYYYDGKKWAQVGNCATCSNYALEINQNISKFEVSSTGIQTKAIIQSSSGNVSLKAVNLTIKGQQVISDTNELNLVRLAFADKPTEAVCGNGVVEEGEQCDDGNNNNLDPCSNQCLNHTPICHATHSSNPDNQYNFLWVDDSAIDGEGSNDHTQHPGDIIPITDINNNGTIDDADCEATTAMCGNGTVDAGEECDDSNTSDGDGCSSQCLTEECGDGIIQSGLGEECDDGNTSDGDGCSGQCKLEAVCGNGILEQGEQCDGDGNPVPAIWCSTQCLIIPGCGNTVLESGEECEDGNNLDGDGCSSQCLIEGAGPVCGNGILETGEQCDGDGNPVPAQWCSAQCTIIQGCGDGILEGEEQCDDANNINEDGCSSSCSLEICGDGIVQTGLGEQCDDGNTNSGDGCSYMCLAEQAVCGNGIVEPGEQCDDGNNDQNDYCSNQCLNQTPICHATGSEQNPYNMLWVDNSAIDGEGANDHTNHPYDIIPISDLNQDGEINDLDCETHMPQCGNGEVELGEECDDSNTTNGDGCSAICTYEYCGDEIVQTGLGEECDDGNTDDGDGCNADCILEHCGDYIIQAGLGEECDDGNIQNGDGCSDQCKYEPICGNERLETGEECDDGNLTDGDGCSSQCLIEGAGPVCGNGILETGEQCDDGNTDNGDGCSKQCRIEGGGGPVCGNGVIERTEECDYQALPSGCQHEIELCQDNCQCKVPICHATASETNPYEFLWVNYTAVDGEGENDHTNHPGDIVPIWDANQNGEITVEDCVASQYRCGNEIVEPGEQCDDGNTQNGDGCTSSCQLETWDLSVIEVEGQCTDGNAVFTITNTSEPITGDMEGPSEYRVYINDVLDESKTANFQLAGGESLTVTIENIGTATVRLEAQQRPGYQGTNNPAVYSIACNCGNTVIDEGEQCDDGCISEGNPANCDVFPLTNGDGCTILCQLEYCGDDIVQSGLGEQCDNGKECSNGTACVLDSDCIEIGDQLCRARSGDGCSNICINEGGGCTGPGCGGGGGENPVCGNGTREGTEQCDDGNTAAGDGCSPSCTFEESGGGVECGNGILEGNEQCDDGNLTSGDGCSSSCAIEVTTPGAFCGNGLMEGAEECDDGNNVGGDGCSASCGLETPFVLLVTPACGNGILEAGEACDDGNVVPGDGCSATCTAEPVIVGGAVGITPAICIDYNFADIKDIYYNESTGRVSFPINGAFTLPTGATLVGLDYNLNGQGWNSINLPTPPATTYSQVLPSLSLSSYSVIVRARFSNGTEALSAPCGFSFVIGCLNIGANQFVLNAQQSPLSTTGVIQFKVGEPQKIYVETQCNNTALIRNVSTGTEYPLYYDPERFKWTTDTLVFNAPGTYDLEVEIANIFGEVYSRIINTVVVVPESSLTAD